MVRDDVVRVREGRRAGGGAPGRGGGGGGGGGQLQRARLAAQRAARGGAALHLHRQLGPGQPAADAIYLYTRLTTQRRISCSENDDQANEDNVKLDLNLISPVICF